MLQTLSTNFKISCLSMKHLLLKNVEEDDHKSPRDFLRRDSLCRNTEIDNDEVIEKFVAMKKRKKI